MSARLIGDGVVNQTSVVPQGSCLNSEIIFRMAGLDSVAMTGQLRIAACKDAGTTASLCGALAYGSRYFYSHWDECGMRIKESPKTVVQKPKVLSTWANLR